MGLLVLVVCLHSACITAVSSSLLVVGWPHTVWIQVCGRAARKGSRSPGMFCKRKSVKIIIIIIIFSRLNISNFLLQVEQDGGVRRKQSEFSPPILE